MEHKHNIDSTNYSFKDNYKSGYEQADDAVHTDIKSYASLITNCGVVICDNDLWDDTSMEKLSDALGMLPNLKVVRVC